MRLSALRTSGRLPPRAQLLKISASTTASAFNFPLACRGRDSLVDAAAAATVVPVVLVPKESCKELLEQHAATAWAAACRFTGSSGEVLLLPGGEGGSPSKVLLGLGSSDPWAPAALAKLPAGTYELAAGRDIPQEQADRVALSFLLGCYRFLRYKKSGPDSPRSSEAGATAKACLVWPPNADRPSVEAMAAAFYFARDLITTPAEDLGPQHLVAEAHALAAAHPNASIRVVQGDELLEQNYPAIHTVGRASSRPPALIDIRWAPGGAPATYAGVSGLPGTAASTQSSASGQLAGPGDAAVAPPQALPLLALVGKGVCFDSGGLNIKSAAGMKLMKKDMGGAALMLALAHVVMSQRLPVRLRLLIPAVENSISGNSFRPLDVLQTRSGITVENGNTDAEGRLILCDALSDAASESPDLIIDAATLTGAARAALGAEVPAVFSSDDAVWAAIEASATETDDPLWRLPLWKSYRRLLDSKVADISSTGGEGGPGAITAALFLQEFVKDVPRWVHIDTGAYNTSAKDGRPEGGEALGLRALAHFLQQRYKPLSSSS